MEASGCIHRRPDSSQQWSEASRTATHGCIDKKLTEEWTEELTEELTEDLIEVTDSGSREIAAENSM